MHLVHLERFLCLGMVAITGAGNRPVKKLDRLLVMLVTGLDSCRVVRLSPNDQSPVEIVHESKFHQVISIFLPEFHHL